MRITWAKLKKQWPFLGFATAFALFFYFFGHLDAVVGKKGIQAIIFGHHFVKHDIYFTVLTFMLILLFLMLFFSFMIAQKKTMTWKQYIIFVVAGIAILPNSVWGLAWHIWFTMKDKGWLTLWEILNFKVAIPWSIYLETQYFLTFIYIGITIGFSYWLAKK